MAAWRKWHTRETQNLVGHGSLEGSTPSAATMRVACDMK